MKRFATVIGLVLVGAVALAGCGGGGGKQVTDLGTLELGPGFIFKPNTLPITAKGAYKIKLVNPDTQLHDFAIEGTNIKKEVAAGKTEVYEFTLDKAGKLNVVCAQPGHKDGGMKFTVDVK